MSESTDGDHVRPHNHAVRVGWWGFIGAVDHVSQGVRSGRRR